ncbi:MAG: sigma 54-interacting transcriptional regulator [Candidatus Rokubacteria bacterium]|nr:sigma 54-interacting transcriptional regulator [Candidatus Rokubacteria bacterium]
MPRAELPSFCGMIGRTSAMRALFRQVKRIAPVDVPVLIQGESGTGKELVATAIHRLSPRSGLRFEVVNCGALTRELLLSELFGHERGAFTGAVERRAGILGAADGGTVFLDEVGELSPEAQVALLRFLANGEIRPVGSTSTRRVDVRLIAATHRDLDVAAREGSFREDFYYRLRRVVLEVPPLRARREDVPLLVEHYRLRFDERYGLAVDGLTDAAMRKLESYTWPGNVRELEAVLEQAMIFKGRGWLAPRDLDLRPVARRAADASHARPPLSGGPGLTQYQEEALGIAERRGEVRRLDLMGRFRISHEFARRQLLALVRMGLLRPVGSGRGARYVSVGRSEESR